MMLEALAGYHKAGIRLYQETDIDRYIGGNGARLQKEENSVNSRQVTTGPDSASDGSHVIFRIQPLKVILLYCWASG